MAKIILVTGGTRSGKSSFALQIAEKMVPPHCFIATCRISDQEMAERVKKHQDERTEKIWKTVEEGLDLRSALRNNRNYSTYLLDCVTLWVSNIMEQNYQSDTFCDENDLKREIDQLFNYLGTIESTVIFVSNEVGMGIVPENQLARRYRDLVGFCNRLIASRAEEVILVSCGLPLYLKTSLKGKS